MDYTGHDTEPYQMYKNGGRADKLIARARKVNAERDRIDVAHGSPSPERCDLATNLRTAMSAIETGMDMRDWNCVAEGFAMLQDAELRARKRDLDEAPGVGVVGKGPFSQLLVDKGVK